MFTIACCLESRVRVRIIFSAWLVSRYANVFLLLSVVIVTLPLEISIQFTHI